jgi:anti-sigma B factor antagonist
VTALTIEHHTTVTGHLLILAGDLDLRTADQLRDLLPAIALRDGQLLVIDLARVEFCDSSGLAALVAGRNHTLAAHADIALTAVPRPIARVLHILGLDTAFPLYPSRETVAGETPEPQPNG